MLTNRGLSAICKHFIKVVALLIAYIWGFFESVLFVGGLIGCIMLPVMWPMKFFYAVLWLVVFYVLSKIVHLIGNDRVRNKKRE